jgi:hypothetical protein
MAITLGTFTQLDDGVLTGTFKPNFDHFLS